VRRMLRGQDAGGYLLFVPRDLRGRRTRASVRRASMCLRGACGTSHRRGGRDCSVQRPALMLPEGVTSGDTSTVESMTLRCS
jgi:hypothetical protein